MPSLVHFEQNSQDVHNLSGEVNPGESQGNMEEDAPSYPPAPLEESHELWAMQESAGAGISHRKLDMNLIECNRHRFPYYFWCVVINSRQHNSK